jgi:phospholipid/cholesterol/gamma-HCH transport system substrate-binding protein
MKSRSSSLMIGSLTLAVIAGSLGGFLGYRKFAGTRQQGPLRVIFEGSASGLHKGGGVNFGGIRVGEVISLKLDNPRRVVALAMVDNSAPIRKDTLVGLEFQGLTGVAAISLTGGSVEAPPVPLDEDGVPVLTADPNALLDTQEKIRVALRNVDKVIADNQDALKDTLLSFETFTASLASSSARIDSVVNSTVSGVGAVDSALTKTQGFLASLASDKSGGELLPTVMSMRELVESFNKRSGALMADGRRMLGDISASINKADRKIVGH